ncbi:WhiB family transcriptional regulator [Arthrobacter echini]|uniref:Transcriptional regulator WhiB n=1 Tax=Arthrobacter echini TaxID=1529066 RepID=A0A4S5E8M8_9MICC|nr:WhiB family transcriptional regulator [Arthrobacter echini]THJ67880.1 WhiB family transcriptional regulator [Arthrobacter echini]
MGQAERTQERSGIEMEAAVHYGSGSDPSDWFFDPAGPVESCPQPSLSALEDQATAFLAAHGALSAFPDALLADAAMSEIVERPSSAVALPSAGRRASDPAGSDAPYGSGTSLFPVPAAPAVALVLPMTPGSVDDDGELSWQTDALCAQTDPEAFFPEKGGSTRDAKKVCGSCRVRSECLEYALDKDERFGIWGGLSERERRRLRRGVG